MSHIIGVGIDACSLSRIEDVWQNNHAERFIKRVCTETEQKQGIDALKLTKIWAMKEAVSKALGVGIGIELSFQDIETYKLASGQPQVTIPAKWAADIHISYTTEKDMVTAFAIATKAV